MSAAGFEKILGDSDFANKIDNPNFFFLASGAYYHATIFPQVDSHSYNIEYCIDRSVMCLEKIIKINEKAKTHPKPKFFLFAAKVYSLQTQIKSESSIFGAENVKDSAMENVCHFFDTYIERIQNSKLQVKPQIYLDAANAHKAQSKIKSWDPFMGNENFRFLSFDKAQKYTAKYRKAANLEPKPCLGKLWD